MRGFFYIMNTLDDEYANTGTAPDLAGGMMTLGTEKPQIRTGVAPNDFVIGISKAIPGKPRRVIYCLKVAETIPFREAWERGETDAAYAAKRGGVASPNPTERALQAEEGPIIAGDIHVRIGRNNTYEHISKAVHAFTWRKDVEGNRDRYVIGDPSSRYWGPKGPVITDEIACLLGGKDFTAQYPLGEGCSYRVINSAPALRAFLKAIGFFEPAEGTPRVVRVVRRAPTT